MDGNQGKKKENIHNNKRKLKITWEKKYLHHIYCVLDFAFGVIFIALAFVLYSSSYKHCYLFSIHQKQKERENRNWTTHTPLLLQVVTWTVSEEIESTDISH